jgi:Protein of unknown function (DUF2950)
MLDFVRHRGKATLHKLVLAGSVATLLSLAACNKPPAPEGPKTFATPDDAGRALAQAAGAQDKAAIVAIFGPGSDEILSTGDPTQDKNAIEAFSRAYGVMNRWRKLTDGNQLLIVGAQNEAFPIPLMKNGAGQWYFDVAAGKEEILARRIGRDELAAIDISAALADSQAQYFAQKHGGVKQYAQKLISDPGQQNGLYWESPQGAPRSPLGPLVAFASEEGYTVKPDAAQPYHGYYFRKLDNQGGNPKGGAKPYVVNGKMTAGFAYLAYPAKYGESGIKSFIINQQGVVYDKDLGKDTTTVAKAMTDFNPDSSWTPLQ